MTELLARAGRRAGLFAFRVLSRPLTRQPLPAPGGIALRMMQQDELLERCTDPALELSAAKAAAGFARGEICAGALAGERLVGYAWSAFAPAPHVDGIWMDFASHTAYTYRAFVHPAYRGQGIAPALYGLADPCCLERGRVIAVLCIEVHNRSSRLAAERSGARDVGFTAYAHVGGAFLSVRTAGVRRVGYRFYLPAGKTRCSE